MLTSGPALQIFRQQPSGAILLEGTVRVHKHVPWHSWIGRDHAFDFGQEPAGVTDRMIVFERLVGEYETSSGEALDVQVKCAVLLEFHRNTGHTCCSLVVHDRMRQAVGNFSVARRSWQPGHSTPMGEAPMEIDAVYGEKSKKGKHVKGKRCKDKGKGKHKDEHESSPKFEGYCGHCKKTVDTRTLLPEWMRRNLSNIHTAVRAAARPESHHHLLVCLQLELRSPRRDRSPR